MTTIDPNSAQAALFEKLGIVKKTDAEKAKDAKTISAGLTTNNMPSMPTLDSNIPNIKPDDDKEKNQFGTIAV